MTPRLPPALATGRNPATPAGAPTPAHRSDHTPERQPGRSASPRPHRHEAQNDCTRRTKTRKGPPKGPFP
jgi:hypothetical protein